MPDWNEYLRPRLNHLDLRAEREVEIIEELSQHLDERYDELRMSGHDEDDARRIAMDELLDPDTLAEDLEPLRQAQVKESPVPGCGRGSLLADLWADLRYSVRSLRNQAGFTAVAILTLALGIGANSAIFALADATVLRPLPLPEAERLVMLWESRTTSPRGQTSAPNLNDWLARSLTVEAMAGFSPGVGSMVLANADGHAQTIPRQWVSAGIFDVLGIRPVAGRTFSAEDDRAGRNAVVLSEAFWRGRFNADPTLIGQTLRLDGDPYTVLGVVPDQAQLLGKTSMWALAPILAAGNDERGDRYLRVVGRLKAGTSMPMAATDMSRVARDLATEYPETNRDRDILVESLQAAMVGSDLRQTALLFLGVVGFVLLICCANVANLLLARATVRTREFAIRVALGASRWRVVRQILVESLLLALLGGVLGLALGAIILTLAPALMPSDLLPGGVHLRFDLRLLAFCMATTLLVGVLFGLAPAWQSTRMAPARAIASESRGTTGRGGKLRNILVVAEVATAVVLLCGAGLLLRTLFAMQNVDRGYRADGTLSVLVDPLGDRYPSKASLLRFFDEIETQLRAVGNVKDVAWSSALPLGAPGGTLGTAAVDVVGAATPREGERAIVDYQVVSPNYLSALDIRMRDGRGFSAGDRDGSVPVCIVNESFVRTHLHGIPALGARLAVRTSNAPGAAVTLREIVGVSASVKARATELEAAPKIYVPLAQAPTDDIYLLVQPRSGNAEDLAPSVRDAIAAVDKEQLVSVSEVTSLADIARRATSSQRFRAILVLTFAMLALLLAMAGVFAILAYSVQQRTRDFGVRMAMGARARDVLLLVLRGAVGMVAASTLIGLVLAMLMGRWLSSVLYAVSPFDLLTFGGVVLVLGLTTFAAALGPAWRAAGVLPTEAMRGT
jgi:putative ABC transport system permease protein